MLRQKHLSMLWASQVLSAIGDQLHSLAVLWISIQIGGANGGFVAAAGTLAGLALGLFGGVYADRWDRRVAMIVVDLLRAIAVFALAIVAQTSKLQLWEMALVAVIVSGLGSLFGPCMWASLPNLIEDETMLRAMTSLMMMTFRIARLTGPALASVILWYFPIHSFFYIDSVSYLVSAAAIWSLSTHYSWRAASINATSGIRGIFEDLMSSAQMAITYRQVGITFITGAVCALLWAAGYVVGIPLMVKQSAVMQALGVTAYAWIICSYGFGNVLSNILCGPMRLYHRPVFFTCLGILIMGTGFLIIALAPNMYIACLGASLAATGGPIGDLSSATMVQQLADEHRGKLNSLANFLGQLGMAIGLSLAAWLFAITGGAKGIALTAAAMMALGISGIALGNVRKTRPALSAAELAEPEYMYR